MRLQGIGASDGIGIGTAVRFLEENLDFSNIVSAGTEAEKLRLQTAIQNFRDVTTDMAEQVRNKLGDKDAEILTGQLMMLEDPYLSAELNQTIEKGQCAEAAVYEILTNYANLFSSMEDSLMQQRATDVIDLRTRLLKTLLGKQDLDYSQLPHNCVLLLHELTPSIAVGLPTERVAAIVTEVGGRTSHAAILARSLQLPAVLGVSGVLHQVKDQETLVVDGTEGIVILSPEETVLQSYQEKLLHYRQELELLSVYRNRKTQDADGNCVTLLCNIGSVQEAQIAQENGAEGIGLFRTEFLFMDRASAPTEEEQYEAYAAVSNIFQGKEVIVRTLDIGGDKGIPYFHMDAEENPFLGYRAIRYCLDHTDLYKTQLRALLRASSRHHNLKIMVPFVTSIEELRSAKQLLNECKKELSAQNIPYDAEIPLGIMVETPAAVQIADLLAQEADFFSIGTNDLTQYTLAVDRGNPKVSNLYTPLHPAVLRSICSVVEAAQNAHIPVGMCGEAAADPRLVPLLLFWGLEEFSVSISSLLQIRKEIGTWKISQAAALTKTVMAMGNTHDIVTYLDTQLSSR